MMDGQVRALRRALDAGGYRQTILMSYSTKFASAERGWGVLRDVVRESAQALVRAGADLLISCWANRYADIFG